MNRGRRGRPKKIVISDSESDEDDGVINLSPPKRERMEISNRVNAAPFIKIQQSVKHDVWDIRRKDDGTFIVKKLNETSGGGAAAASCSSNSESAINVGNTTNPEQLGARPKISVQVPKKRDVININAVSPKNEIRVEVPKRNVITLNTSSAPKNEVINLNTSALPKGSATVKATTATPKEDVLMNVKLAAAPTKGGITMKTICSNRNEVITINTTAPKKEVVINMNTNPTPKKDVTTLTSASTSGKQTFTLKPEPVTKPAVVIMNTASASKKEATSSAANSNASFIKLEQQVKHDTWNIVKEEQKVDQQGESSSKAENDKASQDEIPTVYTEQACRIQEMFPSYPLNVIANDLKVTGALEATIDNILEGKIALPPEPPSHSAASPVVQGNNEVIVQQSSKAEASMPESKKKVGSVIKIELLAKNEVWDIKKKDKEGFVMKKIGPETEAPSQRSTPADEAQYVDNLTDAMEEECDDILSSDIFIDDTQYKGNHEQVNGPVKLMVYAQSSSKHSAVSKKRAEVVPANEKMEASMEVDNFDNNHLLPEECVSLESFDFSDDENEEGITIEHFVFKATLILKKLKYLKETKNQDPGNSELLNITGGSKSEKESDTNMALDDPKTEKGSDTDMAERSGNDTAIAVGGTIGEDDTAMAEGSCSGDDDDDDDYYTDEGQ